MEINTGAFSALAKGGVSCSKVSFVVKFATFAKPQNVMGMLALDVALVGINKNKQKIKK